jgi:hypothetical protein
MNLIFVCNSAETIFKYISGLISTDKRGQGNSSNTKRKSPLKGKLSPHIMKLIFDGINSNLPNSDARRITPTKWIYVLSNLSKSQAHMSSIDVDFGIIIVELIQKDDVFLSLRISKLTKVYIYIYIYIYIYMYIYIFMYV